MSTTNTENYDVENDAARDELLNRVHNLLNEEKWTRATLNSYTVNNFKELDELIDEIEASDLEDDVLGLCEEHLQHTKNSIIALYLSGVLALTRQSIDDVNLIMLTKIFSDNHKWNIVEYLATKILDFGENRFALRILADVYDTENRTKDLHDVWERLIRVDYEEADIVRHLADLRQSEGDTDAAISYYKKALHRYITKRSFANVKELWHKLVALVPEETEFFYHAENKIARTISEERAVQLLEDYFPYFKNNEQWDTAIEVLKRVLNYDPKNPWARKEIVECFSAQHADHSNLEEYIRLSNLNQSWRPVHEAIADFEKHIAFDTGNFVFHRSWGVGRIRHIEGDEITIDFTKKRNHNMSLKMAVNALDVLPKDHIWVLRAVWKKEKLRALVKKNIVWTLKTIIRSLDNAADMKKIKAELVPAILTPGEWSAWSTKARNILKTNPDFGTLTDKLDHFVVRDQPITIEEKTFNKFKAQKSFFDRVKTLEEFLTYVESEEGDGIDTEFFREMFEYFAGFLRTVTYVNEHVICSQMILRRVVARYPFLKEDLELEFKPLYDQIDDLEDVFSSIASSDLKREFLQNVRAVDRDWGSVYVRLLPYFHSREVLLELERHGKHQMVLDFVRQVYESYRDLRETFVWLVKSCDDDPWFDEIGIGPEKRLIAMVHVYDLTFRDIDNRKDVSHNRKINRQVHSFLFKDNALIDYLDKATEDSVSRLFALLSDVKEIDPKIVLDIKQRILNRFPKFRFYGEAESAEVTSRGFMATPSSYQAKQKELVHLQEVEVPENSREIETARSYGDLKENAEYKAALERQESLNNRAGRLKDELEQVRIVKKNEVRTDSIQFGTSVKLTDMQANKKVSYTILGPWESKPTENIISYQSPLGNKLYNHKVGDELDFEINEKRYHLKVEAIEVGNF